MNCAGGGILGRYFASGVGMKVELRVETNRARMAEFENSEKIPRTSDGCGEKKFAHDVHRKIRKARQKQYPVVRGQNLFRLVLHYLDTSFH